LSLSIIFIPFACLIIFVKQVSSQLTIIDVFFHFIDYTHLKATSIASRCLSLILAFSFLIVSSLKQMSGDGKNINLKEATIKKPREEKQED
jgi:hypothetical protein